MSTEYNKLKKKGNEDWVEKRGPEIETGVDVSHLPALSKTHVFPNIRYAWETPTDRNEMFKASNAFCCHVSSFSNGYYSPGNEPLPHANFVPNINNTMIDINTTPSNYRFDLFPTSCQRSKISGHISKNSIPTDGTYTNNNNTCAGLYNESKSLYITIATAVHKVSDDEVELNKAILAVAQDRRLSEDYWGNGDYADLSYATVYSYMSYRERFTWTKINKHKTDLGKHDTLIYSGECIGLKIKNEKTNVVTDVGNLASSLYLNNIFHNSIKPGMYLFVPIGVKVVDDFKPISQFVERYHFSARHGRIVLTRATPTQLSNTPPLFTKTQLIV